MKHFLKPKSPLALGKSVGMISGLILTGCFQTGGEPPVSANDSEVADAGQAPPAPEAQQADAENHSPGASNRAAEDPNASTATEAPAPKLGVAEPCGQHSCVRFEHAKDALRPLILERKARLIAFGEAHTPADFSGPSTVRRFTENLLPEVASGSSHLLVELLQPPKEGCQRERTVAQQESTAVTQGQSQNNQTEYLALGVAAHKLGVTPDILYASCEDIARIAAPDGGVVAMMESIASLSADALTKYLQTTRKGRPLVLAYGGALHNDATPRPSRASWSYGPQMLQATDGSYLEIDLIVPELIQDTDSWRSFPWYDAYQALDHKEGAVLMKWGEHSYSLFFAPGPGSSTHGASPKGSSLPPSSAP